MTRAAPTAHPGRASVPWSYSGLATQVVRRDGVAATGGERRAGYGGRRLAAAFETVSSLPAHAESRRRLQELCGRDAASPEELAAIVEADPGLAIAVLRALPSGERAGSAREAIDAL